MKTPKKFPALADKLKELHAFVVLYKKEMIGLQKQFSAGEKEKKDTSLLKEEMRKAIAKKIAISSDSRHYHVAYSELLGKTRKQIEGQVRENTPKLSEEAISNIKGSYGVI